MRVSFQNVLDFVTTCKHVWSELLQAKVPIAVVNPLLNEKPTDINNASFYSIVSSDHPLHEAIKLSFLMILRSLLDSGVYSVNSQNPMHYSPLQFAIHCKNFEAVEIVTGYPGCNFSVKTSAGFLPLHLASQAGCLELFVFLSTRNCVTSMLNV